MTAVLQADALRIQFVAVAQADAMEVATNEHRHAVRRTVGQSAIQHPLLVRVLHACRHIHPVADAVGTRQQRGVYS